jgi:hypothetical protein
MGLRRRAAGAAFALMLLGSGAGAGAIAVAAPAQAAPADNSDVAYCRSIEGLFGDDIFGPCMSYYNSHDRSAAATDVYFCTTQFVPEGLFGNVGDCVSFLNNFKGD